MILDHSKLIHHLAFGCVNPKFKILYVNLAALTGRFFILHKGDYVMEKKQHV